MHLRSATTPCWLPVKTSLFCLAVNFFLVLCLGLTCCIHTALYTHAKVWMAIGGLMADCNMSVCVAILAISAFGI